jgi:predicted aldo/keto reductase-like oxidoreductase
MTEKYVETSQAPLNEVQMQILNARAVACYLKLAEYASTLKNVGSELLQATVSIQLPGCEHPKIVVLSSPMMSQPGLKDLLETIGKNSDFAVSQAQIVIDMAEYQIRKDQADKCSKCDERETCPERTEHETVQ